MRSDKMKEFICEICEINTLRRFQLEDGRKVCEVCNEALQSKTILDINVPEAVKWVGKVAKQGEHTLFFIPKTQRAFLKHGEKYIVIVRKLK